jgi:uncharacterized FAD-dependent dehydrogenase
MVTIYDVAIIGAGVAGVFAANQILSKQKKVKTILFDIGRPPMKRRSQMFGFGGLLPNSDGKFYLSDTKKVSTITGDAKVKSAYDSVISTLELIDKTDIIKDDGPSKSISSLAKKAGYKIIKNSYIPLFSPHIHGLLKHFADTFENKIEYCFDKEVIDISKNGQTFTIHTNDTKYKCRRVLIATGRAGWRWATAVFDRFGIIEDNSTAKYGIRVEISKDNLQSFDQSTCSFVNDNMTIGPFSWNGTVVPEDHYDMVIANFRSNEERWESDKVSFDFIGNIKCEDGFNDTDRIGKLTFLLANDRVSKERVSAIMNEKSKILTILPEYQWLKDELTKLAIVIPEVLTKAYFYAPALMPMPPKISLKTNLSTDIEGLFVAGEPAGVSGLLAAAEMGIVAANGITRGL